MNNLQIFTILTYINNNNNICSQSAIDELVSRGFIEYKEKSGFFIFKKKAGYYVTEEANSFMGEIIDLSHSKINNSNNFIDFIENGGGISIRDIDLTNILDDLFYLMIFYGFLDNNQISKIIENGKIFDKEDILQILESYSPADIAAEMVIEY